MNLRIEHFLYRFLAVAVLLALVPGCASLGKQSLKPKVTLADMKIEEVRTLETVFQIDLRILNPNDRTLQVDGIECDLRIDDRQFASGVSGERYEIPPYGSALVPINVYASVLDMVSSVITIVQGANQVSSQAKPLRYELRGHVRLTEGNSMKKTYPFETKGELSFDGKH